MKQPQFRLSTILLLIVILGMAIAWWVDHRALEQQLREARKRIQFLETVHVFDAPPAPRRQ